MKLFYYTDRDLVLLCWAFNRGHAAKQISAHLEKLGQAFSKTCPLKEVTQPVNKKGEILVIQEFNFEPNT